MNDSPRPTRVVQPLIERLLLRSRFGRRLLFLFMICALVPTCAVAFLSFRSVSEQLTEQSRERLAALASAAGKTLYDRLSFLENDLRKVIPRLRQCKGNGADSASRDCGEGLLYAVEALARISGDSTILMVGEVARVSKIDPTTLPDLESGQSVVIAQAEPDDYGVYIVHRPADSPDGSVRFVARIDPSYLWSPADEEALPGTVDLSLWDPSLGMLVGSASLSKLSPDIKHQIANTPRGTVEWPGANGASVATWWSLPETRRFRFPAWRVLLSEPQADVLAPMAAFSRTFPLLLTFALLMVLVLGVSQIRRSLVPLAELSRGTRRIADRDFETPVNVSSGDELQELAGAFNGMTLQLGRQFRALKTAAEIDRAVLSSVDTATIVQTVLDRVPEIVACESISMMLLEPGSSSVGTTWIGLCGPSKQTKMATVLTPDDIKETRRHPERLVFGREDLAIPEYLAHFRRAGEPVVVEAYPLGYGGELIGVLAVRRKSGDASEEETVQVRRLADQVAVALSNARMVDQVRFLAFYDSLTRLPNRVLYKERLAQALVRAERSHKLVAVCFLDLDHFSRINDTLGHDLGDVLLKEVAARLVACSRPGDSVSRVGGEESVAEVSRLGGDEFTVILPDITDPQDAVRVARRLLEAFRQPLRLGTQEVFVTTSVGVAIYPFDGADTEELLKSADVAMYHAKEQGRNTYQLYSSSMNAEAMARMQLESQLRKAVESGEFTIWYQPIMDLKTGMPIGAEALVRWAHPERGLVSPGEFISLCEECGLIVPLGEWILRTVCTQAKAWEDVGIGPMRMCVNLSARQLRHDGIVDTVRNIVRETGIQPGCLELELTESMLMEPAGVVGRTIRELADLGVSLAIDDFGTGYSSLSYLKNFPVKTLKIDRTFIMNLTTDSGNAAITTAIIALAGAMGLEVVAEGVETAAQADFLRERGCHRGQGYLFGKPLPVIEFENYLRGETPVKAGRMAAVAGASA